MTPSTGRRLVLWDIDGTLLTTGPVGRLALETGARVTAGLEAVPKVDMGGKTDPQILREILTAAGLGDSDIDAGMPAALDEARRVLDNERARIREQGAVQPGVRDLLAALSATAGVRQSLVTGNIAANARVKVAAFGLAGHFDLEVGAYGDDHEDRDCLVPIALGRVRRLRGEVYPPDRVWVVGDTASDLRCARAAGVRAVIVGTGRAGHEAVRGLDADAVLPDLSDTDLVLRILLGRHHPSAGAPVDPAAGAISVTAVGKAVGR